MLNVKVIRMNLHMSGALRGFFDFAIEREEGNFDIFKDWKMTSIPNRNGDGSEVFLVNSPSTSFEVNGEKKYKNFVHLSTGTLAVVRDAAKEKYNELIGSGNNFFIEKDGGPNANGGSEQNKANAQDDELPF